MRKVYQMVPPLFQEEEIYYFDGIIKEGQKFYKLIQKRQEEMIGKKTVLRKLYKELMNMCNKPDVELLQVSTEDLFKNTIAESHTFDFH